MTDAMKVKHTIAVLEELEQRYIENVPLENLIDLRGLLRKKHVTETMKATREICKEASPLCVKLHNKIQERKPDYHGFNQITWSINMDKILRIDKRTVRQIEDVIAWSQYDDFWQNNILSPMKLRKHFDRLEMAMKRDHKWTRDHKLCKPVEGKSAKDRYIESLNGDKDEDAQRDDGRND